LLAVGMTIIFTYLLLSLWTGRRAPANPWGAATLEWQCSSPPPYDNFPTPPAVGDPYDFSDIQYDANIGGYVRTPQAD
jgi:cytochrome c oxidase subunit 1